MWEQRTDLICMQHLNVSLNAASLDAFPYAYPAIFTFACHVDWAVSASSWSSLGIPLELPLARLVNDDFFKPALFEFIELADILSS